MINAVNKKILIIDDDAEEASKLSVFLSANNCTVCNSTTIFKTAVQAIEKHLPDVIILSMNRAEEDIIGLEIAQYIPQIYFIQVILVVEYHEHEDLYEYIKTFPYSCHFKSKEYFHKEVLNTILFSEPHIVGKLCKYRAKVLYVTPFDIDEKGEPISYDGMEHDFADKEIKLCDVLYFKAGNAHQKNCVFVRLKSDKSHYHAFRGTLIQCITWLNYRLFTQYNGSYIVNNEQITAWNLPKSVTADDIVIDASRNYKDDIKAAYHYYHPDGK